MKKMFALFLIFVVPFITTNSKDWLSLTGSKAQSITDIHMFNTSRGIACGGGGLLYKTENGGITWNIVQSPVTTTLYAITFVDNWNGYIGTDKQVLVTKDGGSTWTKLPITDATGMVKDLYFSDVNNGQALVSATSGGQIFKTTDGGITWTKTLQASKDLLAFSFYSPTKGVATGKDVGTLYYTTDGNTWVNSPTPTLGGFNYTRSDIWGVYMVSENVAYGTGWGSRAAGLQPTIHIKTTNGGQTWEYQTLPENQRTYVNFEDIYFKDVNNGFCVGGSSSYEGGMILKTTDGGINWEYVPAQLGFPIISIHGNGDNLWVVGDAGCVAYSSDFGVNWELIVPYPSSFLYDLTLSGYTVFGGGFTGAFVKINFPLTKQEFIEGGFAVVNNKSPKINEIQFFGDSPFGNNTIYMARSNNLVCKSTDNGSTWTALTKDSSSLNLSFNGLHFLDENTGFVAGKIENPLIKTTDGGQTWTQLNPNSGVDLNDVYFTDLNNGVVIGKNKTVKYTTDGGINWENATLFNIPPSAPSTAELKRITFSGSNIGYIAGALNFKTTDGGKNWYYLELPDKTISMTNVSTHDGSFVSKVCFTGGNHVYESEDNGNTWNDIVDTNVVKVNTLYSCKYDYGGFVWVCGSNSSIYTTNPLVSVDEPTISNSFYIDQNYPNPFNPSTKINYSLVNFSKVELSVYNMLGQKICELVNSEQSAGKYSVQFNAENLSSGVYFYTIRVDNYIQTKKMILVK